MVTRNKIFLFLLTALLCLLSLSGEEKVLTVIQTADLHGAMNKNRIFRTAELVRSVTEQSGGVERSLRIDCGDLIQGSHAMTFEPCRQAMFSILSDLDFEVFVPGNHDLEFGVRSLQKILGSFRGNICAANWQWGTLPAKKDYVILHKNGLKVAVIGLGYRHAAELGHPSEQGLIRTHSIRRTMHRIMGPLMKEKPHIILLALHAGEHTRLEKNFTVRDLVKEFPQIDLVLSAHSHQESAGSAVWKNTLRIQAPALGKGIAVARIVYDTQKHAVTSLKTKLVHVTGDTPVHPQLYRSLHGMNRIVKRESRRIVGNVPFELGPLRRGELSNGMTKLCAEAIAGATGAQIVFYSGSSRFRKSPGVLNEFELFLLTPYEEFVGVMELDKSECMQILEEQLRHQRKSHFQSPYNLTFRRKRSRVTFLSLPGKNRNGQYRCAFSSYALSGAGGRFPVLRDIACKHQKRFYPATVRDMLRKHISEKYPSR